MKSNLSQTRVTLKQACLASCQKILAQAKVAIFTEWEAALATQKRLLQLALNEAEAQAWQTQYPHLVFPVLAVEKVQAVVAWNRRQQSLRTVTALAA
jgi:gamma-glutamyl phosphate reductase